MPVMKVGSGYRYGQTGKIYYGPGAYHKALLQGIAIRISQNEEFEKKAKRGRDIYLRHGIGLKKLK